MEYSLSPRSRCLILQWRALAGLPLFHPLVDSGRKFGHARINFRAMNRLVLLMLIACIEQAQVIRQSKPRRMVNAIG